MSDEFTITVHAPISKDGKPDWSGPALFSGPTGGSFRTLDPNEVEMMAGEIVVRFIAEAGEDRWHLLRRADVQ